MDRNQRREYWSLGLLFVIATIVRILLGRFFPGPAIFTDEFQNVEMARSFAAGRHMMWDNAQTFYPNWLYSMALSPFVNLTPWKVAYGFMRAVDAVMLTSTLVPTYFLTRELASHRRAMAAAALVALMPAMGYGPLLMNDNLFLPAVMFGVWLIYVAVLRPTFANRLLAGIACGVAFHVKPHGVLMPAIAAATVGLYELDQLRQRRRESGAWDWTGLARGIARHWVMALGWVIAMIPRAYVVLAIEQPAQGLTPLTLLGGYAGLAAGYAPAPLHKIFISYCAYVLAWLLMVGFLPGLTFAREGWRTLRGQAERPVSLYVILMGVATALLLAVPARHTMMNNEVWRIHERYFFHILPMAFALFVARDTVVLGRKGRAGLWLLALAAGAWAAWTVRHTQFSIASTSPSMGGFLLMFDCYNTRRGVASVAVFAAAGLISAALILLGPQRPRRQYWAVALLLLTLNFGWYALHRQVGKWAKPMLTVAAKVDKVLEKPQDQLLVLHDKMKRQLAWHVGMRNPGLGVYINRKDTQWGDWWSNQLEFAADGQLISPFPHKHSWLLASNYWRFNQKPVKRFDDCALYHLGGQAPLRLNMEQLLVAREGVPPLTAAQAKDLMQQIRLTVLEKRLPAAWGVGQPARVTLRLRNDSGVKLPGATEKLGLGYHWSDPVRTGNWNSVVWDDGHFGAIDANIAPGQEFTVTFDVVGPPSAGEQWHLTLAPFRLAGEAKSWASKETLIVRGIKAQR